MSVRRDYCHRCPVIDECLNAGMDEMHGIWGGTTPKERRALRVRRAAQQHIRLMKPSAL